MSRIRVLIVARVPLIREGLRGLLAAEADFELAVANPGADGLAVADILAQDPDVVLLDVEQLERDGWGLLGDVAQVAPGIVVLIVSGNRSDSRVPQALELGARGYLMLDMGAEEMAGAIRAAHTGTYVIHAAAIRALLERYTRTPLDEESVAEADEPAERNRELIEPLSERELEVLRLMTRGLSNKQIAVELSITEHTVKFHIRAILGKLGATNRTEAVTQALQRGIVTL